MKIQIYYERVIVMSQYNLHEMGDNGKKLGGGAAQLRRIKKYGGWDNYHFVITDFITKKVYREMMEELNRPPLYLVK